MQAAALKPAAKSTSLLKWLIIGTIMGIVGIGGVLVGLGVSGNLGKGSDEDNLVRYILQYYIQKKNTQSVRSFAFHMRILIKHYPIIQIEQQRLMRMNTLLHMKTICSQGHTYQTG